MKSPKKWFSLGPYSDEDGRKVHWYNCYEEWQNERVKIVLGDMHALSEYENGGNEGPTFSIEVALCQEDIDEFYLPDNEKAVYDIHSFHAIFWRWGIYLSVRGRVQ